MYRTKMLRLYSVCGSGKFKIYLSVSMIIYLSNIIKQLFNIFGDEPSQPSFEDYSISMFFIFALIPAGNQKCENIIGELYFHMIIHIEFSFILI